MNKYDFGYEITDSTTNDWAFHKIKPNSRILEFGSSNGILTKSATEQKNCIVDIVEMNEDAGREAAKFANRCFIGPMQGNIENYMWYDALKNEKYDCIIFLDVLEHLQNPTQVLTKCKELLHDDASILLSVPNIAHNSIIINLINNKFEYTSLGLLDDTHIRFFAYDTLCKMVEDSGFCAVEQQAIQQLVGLNEIKNNYTSVSHELAQQLRLRQFADVYQFTFELKKKELYTSNQLLCTTNLDFTLYEVIIFIKEKQDTCFSEEKTLRYYVNPNEVCIQIDLSAFPNATQIRVDPLDVSCILKNMQIYTKQENEINPIIITSHNGVINKNGDYIFGDNDPQLTIDIQPDMKNILYFSYQCFLFDDDIILLLQELNAQNSFYNAQIIEITEKCENEKQNLNEDKNKLQLQLEETNVANTSLQLQLEQTNVANSSLQLQLEETNVANTSLQLQLKQTNAANASLQLQLEETNGVNASLQLQLNQTTQQKETLEKTLHNIYHSKGWKFIVFIKRIKEKLKNILEG